MTKNSAHKAAIPNPLLEHLAVLVGEWNMLGSHPLLPDIIFHGRASLEWLDGGAFLRMYLEIEEPEAPDNISLISRDDSKDGYTMLYFDERGVSRIYEMSLSGNVWKLWRNAPGFSQRFTGTFVEEGTKIIGQWELAKDGTNWERDLEMTYTRVLG